MNGKNWTSQDMLILVMVVDFGIKIIGIGHTCLVKNALYIPVLANGIISIPKRDKDGYDIRIRDGGLNVPNQDSEVVLNGFLENDLYELGRLYKQMLLRHVCDGNYEVGVTKNIIGSKRGNDITPILRKI